MTDQELLKINLTQTPMATQTHRPYSYTNAEADYDSKSDNDADA